MSTETVVGWTIEEVDAVLRYQVYGPVFGRRVLMAAFLTEDDARKWMAAQKRRMI